ncbi:hypothetical protein AAMO2058_000309000 [Amorphochlora amoebiformis]
MAAYFLPGLLMVGWQCSGARLVQEVGMLGANFRPVRPGVLSSGIAFRMDKSGSGHMPVILRSNGNLRADVATYIITMPNEKNSTMDAFHRMGLKEYSSSIFEALGPHNIDIQQFKNSPECPKSNEECQGLSNGEIGCALSHRRILQDFLSKPELKFAVVFEEDARANPVVVDYFKSDGGDLNKILLRLVDTYSEIKWDELNLGSCYGDCGGRIYLNTTMANGKVRFADLTRSFCAHASLISRKGAGIIEDYISKHGLGAADHEPRIDPNKFMHVIIEPRLFDQGGGGEDFRDGENSMHGASVSTPQYNNPSCIPDKLQEEVGHH